MTAVLGLCAIARSAGAQTPGSWFGEVSAAFVFGQAGYQDFEGHVVGGGAAWNATIGWQALPWLAFTGDVGVLQVHETFNTFIPEDRWTVDDAAHATLMAGVRLEPPVRSGPAPSLEFGTGLGWLRWGDRHFTSINSRGWTARGDDGVAWGWSAGFRLRFATLRRVLTPQAMVRAVGFFEQGHSTSMTTLGFGLRY
jgi:hypothetical protein